MAVNIMDPKAAHTWPWPDYPGVPDMPTIPGKHLVFWDGEYVILSWFPFLEQWSPYGWYTNVKNGIPVGPRVLANAVYHARLPDDQAVEAAKLQGYREIDASAYTAGRSGLDLPPSAAEPIATRVGKARSDVMRECLYRVKAIPVYSGKHARRLALEVLTILEELAKK